MSLKIFRTLDTSGLVSFVQSLMDVFIGKEGDEAMVVANSLNDLDRRVDDAEKRCTTMDGHYQPENGTPVKATQLTTPFGQFVSAIETDEKGHITGVISNPVAAGSTVIMYDNSTGTEQDADTEQNAEKDPPSYTKNGHFTFKFWSTGTQVTKEVFSVGVEMLGTAGGMAGNLYDSMRIKFVMDITPSDLATAMGVKTLEKQESFYFRPSNPKNKIIGKDVKKLDYPHRVTFYPDSSSTTMWVVIEGVFMWNVTNTDIETMLSDMDGYICLRNNP